MTYSIGETIGIVLKAIEKLQEQNKINERNIRISIIMYKLIIVLLVIRFNILPVFYPKYYK